MGDPDTPCSKPEETKSDITPPSQPEGTKSDATVTAVAPPPEMAVDRPVSRPSWFTPRRLLVIFCIINMLNYLDRGVIASNGVNGSRKTCSESGVCTSGSGIQGDFDLSNFEDGILSSAFMVGLLVASPIFASLAKRNCVVRE